MALYGSGSVTAVGDDLEELTRARAMSYLFVSAEAGP